jgi:hypothetical protein
MFKTEQRNGWHVYSSDVNIINIIIICIVSGSKNATDYLKTCEI